MDYLNKTSNEYVKLKHFDRVPAAWGFFSLYVDKKYLKGHKVNNVTLTLYEGTKGNLAENKTTTIPIALTKPELDNNGHGSPSTKNHTLSIALPVVFGFIALMLVGVCLWNRKTRRIELGNIMSRNRHGYTGRKTRRMFRGRKDNGIQLAASEDVDPSEYRDVPEMPRRDSDALGSLANSPVDPSFPSNGHSNAFRDELKRQELERR